MLTAQYLRGRPNIQTDLDNRQMKDSSNWMLNKGIFNKNNKNWGPLEVDLFADRLNTQLRQYKSWRPDGNRCIPDKIAKGERLCVPPPLPFLSENKMLWKSAEGKGGYCNNISSMANPSILSNLMLLALSIDNPILLPSLQ